MTYRRPTPTLDCCPDALASTRDAIDHGNPVCWTTPGLKFTRVRLRTDRWIPHWDISYIYGELDGKPVLVRVPFPYMPKRNMRSWLYKEMKKTGRYIDRSFFEAISKFS